MEKINIVELLKDCPKGMELDCAMFDDIEFDSIVDDEYCPIRCRIKHPDGGYNIYNFTKHGYWNNTYKAKCVIFPKGKTTWEGFRRPFKDGDVLAAHECLVLFKKFDGLNIKCYCTYHFMNNPSFYVDTLQNKDTFHPATEEEKEKLFQAIKDNGYKWNAETKTLEKLIEPKLKEIHFYKDSIGIGYLYKSALKTHNTTVLAIQNGWDTIYSYAISALDFSWLLDKGYKIFLHENGKCGELHEGTTELTDKELSKHHDIRRIWIGGGFEDFFYK